MAGFFAGGGSERSIRRICLRHQRFSPIGLAKAVRQSLDHAADLCAFLYGMGVNVETLNAAPTSAMYRTCQRYIILRFSAQVMRLRQQNSATLADRLDDEAAGIIERLRKLPQDMGATRPTSVHSPNIMHSNADYPEAIYSKSIASRSRLAINATQDKM